MGVPFVLMIVAAAGVVAWLVAARAGVSPLTAFFLALPIPLSLMGEQGGGNVSASDAIIGVCLFTLLSRAQWQLGTAGQAVTLFLVIAGFSSVLSDSVSDMALGLGRMALVSLVPLAIFANAPEPVRLLRQGLTAYCVTSAALALCSMIAFAIGGATASMYTLGIHKNALGPIFGSAVVTVFAGICCGSFRTRQAATAAYGVLAATGVGLLLCLSRGGWAGTLAGLLVVMLFTGRVKPALLALALCVPVLVAVWAQLPTDKVEYATNLSTNSYVLRTRIDSMGQALEAFRTNPLLGAGVGLERRVEPHNVFVLALGSTGIAGLATFMAMVATGAATLVSAVRRCRAEQPDRAVLLAGLAVFTVYHVQTLIDVYWRRGVGALSWACVGVAVAVNAASVAGAWRPPTPPGDANTLVRRRRRVPPAQPVA